MSPEMKRNSHRMEEDQTLAEVTRRLQSLSLSLDSLRDISSRFTRDMTRGLDKQTHHKAPVKMLPTFVRTTPDGTEEGDFLALDLGGTNFRVLYVRVRRDEQNMKKLESQTCVISKELMTGTGEQLFDHIAACLGTFLDDHGLKDQVLPLGFTFSFPCELKEIDKSILIRWTKGFHASGVEGRDVVQLLKEAVSRRGDYKIGPVAMVNDTVATMMSCGYMNQNCEIAMIIGTGTNVCYMEEMCNVKRIHGDNGRMCINTEWGGFGDDGSLRDVQTEMDLDLDRSSINPGVHIFEKMISGMYLGEIVRLLLVKMAQDGLLFQGQVSDQLQTPGAFTTSFISEVEEEGSGPQHTERILTDLSLRWSAVDLRAVRLVCHAVSSRAARLCAAALAAVANRIRTNRGLKQLHTTVAVDGTVYKKHPNFKAELQDVVQDLAPQCTLDFLVSVDSSGKGAAMVTAVAQRIAAQSHLIDNEEDEDEDQN